MRLIIRIVNIKGTCPVYRVGDKVILEEGYKMDLDKSDNLCLHSLVSLLPYYVALSKGVAPKELGLTKGDQKAYLQCLDPCEYTAGGTVIMEIERE